MAAYVGLDFGTSNSGVALSRGGKVHLLPIDRRNVTPEVVKTILYITRNERSYIGQEAVELYYQHNVNRIRRYVKKWAGEIEYIGSEMHYVRDTFVEVDELQPGRLIQYLKTALRKSDEPSGYLGTQIFERYYETTDLIRVYLRELKFRAEELLGEPIHGVVIGRPVSFSECPKADLQAQSMLHEAAVGAGFDAVQFELEPVAAALFYEKTLDMPQTTLIFDFGGGTLDLAIMRLGELGRREVIASAGIDIAGSDFDRTIIEKRLMPFFGSEAASFEPEILEMTRAVPDWIALPELSTPRNRYLLERAIQHKTAPVQLSRLRALIFNDLAFSFYSNVEAAKIALSDRGATVIKLAEKDLDIWELYTRSQFEKDLLSFREKIETFVMNTLEKSGLEPGQIEAVVKTGGSSNIPVFSEMLGRVFGKERLVQSSLFSSVSAGLAIRAEEAYE